MKVLDPNDPLQRVEVNRRNERRWWWDNTFWPITVTIAILVGGLGLDLLWNQAFYGDWQCAFIQCVRVQDVKNPQKVKP